METYFLRHFVEWIFQFGHCPDYMPRRRTPTKTLKNFVEPTRKAKWKRENRCTTNKNSVIDAVYKWFTKFPAENKKIISPKVEKNLEKLLNKSIIIIIMLLTVLVFQLINHTVLSSQSGNALVYKMTKFIFGFRRDPNDLYIYHPSMFPMYQTTLIYRGQWLRKSHWIVEKMLFLQYVVSS